MPEVHKKGQGVLVRRIAFWALAVLIVWGGQAFYTWLIGMGWGWPKTLVLESGDYLSGYEIPVLKQRFDWAFVAAWGMTLGGCWMLYRLLNKPKSADFLVETNEELKKVTWPSWRDAMNSSLIVLVFVVILAAFLFASDKILGFGVGLLLQ